MMAPVFPMLLAACALLVIFSILCGYRAALLRFAGVALAGLLLNGLWMSLGLGADVFAPRALTAQLSLMMFASACFATGWLAGRFARSWQESRVEQP